MDSDNIFNTEALSARAHDKPAPEYTLKPSRETPHIPGSVLNTHADGSLTIEKDGETLAAFHWRDLARTVFEQSPAGWTRKFTMVDRQGNVSAWGTTGWNGASHGDKLAAWVERNGYGLERVKPEKRGKDGGAAVGVGVGF